MADRAREAAPLPRVTTISEPSGLHTGWAYSDGEVVSCRGVPPPAGTFHTWPPSPPSHVVYAIQVPSGDHDGENSWGPSPLVSRVGVPPRAGAIHTRPTAWTAMRDASGEAAYQRSILASKGPSSMRKSARVSSEMVRCTRTEKGTVATSPLSTSRMRILPPCVMTIRDPSALQL